MKTLLSVLLILSVTFNVALMDTRRDRLDTIIGQDATLRGYMNLSEKQFIVIQKKSRIIKNYGVMVDKLLEQLERSNDAGFKRLGK